MDDARLKLAVQKSGRLTDPSLDMYDERNGFKTPTKIDGSDAQWSRYDDSFVKRFRSAQIERVKRIDAIARGMIEENARAEQLHNDPDFAKLSPDRAAGRSLKVTVDDHSLEGCRRI